MLSGALSRSPNSRISAPYFRIGKYQGKYLGEVRGDLLQPHRKLRNPACWQSAT
jgi:hypothetical protein